MDIHERIVHSLSYVGVWLKMINITDIGTIEIHNSYTDSYISIIFHVM